MVALLLIVSSGKRRTKTTDLSRLTTALATRLRMAATARNLKQVDLVRATGYDKRQVSLIWRGEQLMTVDQMDALFHAVGADPATEFAAAKRASREPEPTPPGASGNQDAEGAEAV